MYKKNPRINFWNYCSISLPSNQFYVPTKKLDEANIDCSNFADLQKASKTVEQGILLSKRKHYGIHVILNEWLNSSLPNRKQHVLTNDYDSNLATVKFDILQELVFYSNLIWIFINHINQSIKLRKVHHFADDKIPKLSKSINKLNNMLILIWKPLPKKLADCENTE